MSIVINMDAGHNKYAPGASSFLDEVAENRKVHKQLTADLQASGFKVNNCTDDSGKDADSVLYNIVSKSNKIAADLHMSLHLNSGRKDKVGDGKTGGTEVFNYDERTKALSDLICKQIAADLGITNRGTKYEPGLYVLRKTNALAILIECCFTDDKDDYKKWDAIKCAHAIAKAVCAYYGVTYKGGGTTASKPSESKPSTSTGKKSINTIALEVIDGDWGDGDTRKQKLKAAGYDYATVQAEVNRLLGVKKSKTTDELVQEVIDGKWGNGDRRVANLTAAGYDAEDVQAKVNAKLKGTSAGSGKKSAADIALEIYYGKCSDSRWSTWGTGDTREERLKAAGYNPDVVQREVNKLF